MDFGTKIKLRRIELGLTLQEIADMCGVTKQCVGLWETRQVKNIKIDKIQKLAKALKVEPLSLIADANLETLDNNAYDGSIQPNNELQLSEMETNIFGIIMQLTFDEKISVYTFAKELLSKHNEKTL